MNFERHLLSKILKERDLRPALDAKITPGFFHEDAEIVYEFILGYWTDYGNVPTPKVIFEECDGWKPVDTHEDFGYLIDRVKETHKRDLLAEGIKAAASALNDDADEAQSHLQHALTLVGTEVTSLRDENLVTTWKERLSYYRELESLPGGLRGLPTGFRTIDRATSGVQNQQLITLVGPPKSGKSTTVLCAALAMHDYGARPLVMGFEMSNQEQEARHDAILARIDHQRLMNGRLTPDEWERLEDALSRRKSMQDFILSADQSATTTLAGVRAKIEQYDPSVVIIDGVYMMETPEINAEPGSPQSLTYLTRNLKRMAQAMDKPIIITTQVIESRFNRKKGLKATDIGYSSSFAQDSDVVLGIEPTDDPNTARLRVIIARSCPKIYADITWDWSTGTFKEVFGGDDAEEEDKVDTGAFA